MSALLGDTPKLVEYGTALMSNLATKEVRTHIIRILWVNFDKQEIFNRIPQSKPFLLRYIWFETI